MKPLRPWNILTIIGAVLLLALLFSGCPQLRG